MEQPIFETQISTEPSLTDEQIMADLLTYQNQKKCVQFIEEIPKIVEKKSRRKRKFNKSLWTLQQNLKYIQFLTQNQNLFVSSKENRRVLKINKLISLYVKTRSPDQCRSHHQKMLKYHQSITGIINHVGLLDQMYQAQEIQQRSKNLIRIRKRTGKHENKSQIEEQVTPIQCQIMEEGLWDVLVGQLGQVNNYL